MKQKTENTNPIAFEQAELEFGNWAEAMDLEFETDLMSDEDTDSFEKQKRRMVRAIERGHLVIDPDGKAVYTTQKSSPPAVLTWDQFGGGAISSTDGKKKNQRAAQTFAAMARMTKTNAVIFSKMQGIDNRVCNAIFILLAD